MKWKKMNLQQFADAHEQLQNTTGLQRYDRGDEDLLRESA